MGNDEILKMFEGLSVEEASDLVDDIIRAIVRGDERLGLSAQEDAAKFIKDMVQALIEYTALAAEQKSNERIELQKE